MADKSAIEWTDATVNFWWGCTKVGPGCDHCYAETWAKRTGHSVWGQGVPRRKIKSAVALLDRLSRDSIKFADEHDGRARRVFIQSMSDLFDLEVYDEWFAGAWARIEEADTLDLQIVTKRISAVEKRLAELGRTSWPKHAGLMITVVNQAEADRDIPRLLALKAKFKIPWVGLSIEPMLGPIHLRRMKLGGGWYDVLAGWRDVKERFPGFDETIDWVIVGGESGPHARPMHPRWPLSLHDQCKDSDVPFLFKQWGEWAPHKPVAGGDLGGDVRVGRVRIVHPTGQSDVEVSQATGGHSTIPGSRYMIRVGKKAAGRLLDGVTHDGFPRGSSCS